MKPFLAIVILLFESPLSFPLMLLGGEYLPHPPELEEISEGSWYHKAKGYWAECFRADGEWWAKFCRFVIWWQTFFLIWSIV